MKVFKTIDDVLAKSKEYLTQKDIDKILIAYEIANECHEGQARKSNDPYITHPVEVAYILSNLKQDANTICAGLLHDTLEDTTCTEDVITEKLGETVTNLVQGVTKLGKIYFDSREAQQVENFRKMFLAMAKDIRVVIIKLADRLHNMRTLKHLPQEKQRRISVETREIFAPLAHRLGIWSLKWELEDLSFLYLQPEDYQEIKQLVITGRQQREEYINQFMEELRIKLAATNIEADIQGRPKHFYSIYKKLESQKISFSELYDILGIRIMVKEVSQCYQILGVVHSMYKPISGRIKDYIALPKSNMYQSLHTTVIGPNGKPIEIQIRTFDMHKVSEFGVAAHWTYKEGQKIKKIDENFSWLRQLVEFHQTHDKPSDFLNELKLDLFIDEVFVFTPKGEIQVLPKGSTPVGFAYKIHTEIGHSCVGAKVNGRIVPLSYQLRNGDQISIITSNKQNPKLSWLDFVQTGQAKNKIKQWFRRRNSVENVAKGQKKLERLLLVLGIKIKEVLTESFLKIISKKFSVESYDQLFRQIALNETSARLVATWIKSQVPDKVSTEEKIIETDKSLLKHKPTSATSAVHVVGESNIDVRLAQCCNPLPGDNIIGFITLGVGVSVHRSDCTHIYNLPPDRKSRLIEVEWEYASMKGTYNVTISIESFDRVGLLQDILKVISAENINITMVDSKRTEKGIILTSMTLDIKHLDNLKRLKRQLANVSDVLSVRRVTHA